MQFYSNLAIFKKQKNATNERNEMDQQSVKAQVLLLNRVTSWKCMEQNLSHIKRRITHIILLEEYIVKIKI